MESERINMKSEHLVPNPTRNVQTIGNVLLCYTSPRKNPSCLQSDMQMVVHLSRLQQHFINHKPEHNGTLTIKSTKDLIKRGHINTSWKLYRTPYHR